MVVELDDAIRHHQRVVIGQRYDASAEADEFRALGGDRDKDFGGADDFESRRMVLTDPGLVKPEPTALKPVPVIQLKDETDRVTFSKP